MRITDEEIAAILDGLVVDTRLAVIEDERDALKTEVRLLRAADKAARAGWTDALDREDALLARIATLEAAAREEIEALLCECRKCKNSCSVQESDGSYQDPCEECYARLDRIAALRKALEGKA